MVETGAKKYNKEHGDGTLSLKMFDKDTRNEVAKEFEKMYYANVQDMAIDFKPKTKGTNPRTVKNKKMINTPSLFLIQYARSKKIIASFDDKNLAIEYAKALATKSNRQVAIHEHYK